MDVFWLSRSAYSNQLSGVGSALRGARWNSQGIGLVYTAQNRSLAMAEVVVHLTLAMLPNNFELLTIEIPNTLEVEELELTELPANWKEFPHSASTQKIGDAFVKAGKSAVLKVPSVVTPGELNYLINPLHPDFKMIRIKSAEPFPLDHRLFQ